MLIAGLSGIGSLAVYATCMVNDRVTQLRYRLYIILVLLLSVCACLWWALVYSHGKPPLSLDLSAIAGVLMLVGICRSVYRKSLGAMNPWMRANDK